MNDRHMSQTNLKFTSVEENSEDYVWKMKKKMPIKSFLGMCSEPLSLCSYHMGSRLPSDRGQNIWGQGSLEAT